MGKRPVAWLFVEPVQSAVLGDGVNITPGAYRNLRRYEPRVPALVLNVGADRVPHKASTAAFRPSFVAPYPAAVLDYHGGAIGPCREAGDFHRFCVPYFNIAARARSRA
jgi:hypothetical protein